MLGGNAARGLSRLAAHAGDQWAAWSWILDAHRRCNRVSDRYVCVSAYVGLAHLELASEFYPDLVPALATRLRDEVTRNDLPELAAWALGPPSSIR